MNIVFATTNKRKIEDVLEIIKENNLDIKILTLNDIKFTEEIEETGTTIAENSLLKAQAVCNYCKEKGLDYPILSDDAGLFIEALNGEPGIYTARYADEELKKNPTLPKYQCVVKVLNKLQQEKNRTAEYRVVVTLMFPNGEYFQQEEKSIGTISKEMIEPVQKPYFYSVFCLKNKDKTFNQMTQEELKDTYRYKAMKKILIKTINHK